MQPYAFNIVMPGNFGAQVGLLCASIAARYQVSILTAWGIDPGAERFHLPQRDAAPKLAEVTYFPAAAHVKRLFSYVDGPETDTINAHMFRLIAEDLGIDDRVAVAEFLGVHYPDVAEGEKNRAFMSYCYRRRAQFITDCWADATTIPEALNYILARGQGTILHEHRVYETAARIAANFGIAAGRIGDVIAVVLPGDYSRLRSLAYVSGVTAFAFDARALDLGTMKGATVNDIQFESLPRSVWDQIFGIEDATQQAVRYVILGDSLAQVFHRF